MNKAKGIICAMVTPMNEDESINEVKTRKMVNKLINAGVHGIFALGSTGEFYALDQQEKEDFIKIVVDEAAGRVQIYAGAGGIGTKDIINRIKRLSTLGIDGVSILTPYYMHVTQEEVYTHFKTIAQNVDIPIIMYNIPSRTSIHMEPETVGRLSRIPNIIAIKDTSGDPENIKKYVQASSDDFNVLVGDDRLVYQALEYGASGAVVATSNLIPEILVSIYEDYLSSNYERSNASQESIMLLSSCFSFGMAPAILKEALAITGFDVGPTRLPLLPLDKETHQKLEKIVKGTVE